MPTSPYLYADDLINVLKKKHASGTYKSLVNGISGFCYGMKLFIHLAISKIMQA